MSYINFDFTHRFAAGAPQAGARTSTITAGFGREGGRLEVVERAQTSPSGLGEVRTAITQTPAVAAAATGVLAALQSAGWVQSITVEHGDGAQPDTVAWTFRNGRADTGIAGSLPAPVQSVLDAATLLERAVQRAS